MYGHIVWVREKMNIGKYLGISKYFGFCYDIKPELTGDVATVEYSDKDDSPKYRLNFDKHGSISWFDENIIKLIV